MAELGTAPKAEEAEVDPKDQEIADLKTKLEKGNTRLSEYEKMVLSEEYMQFLASKGQGKEEEVEEEVSPDDLENMSKKELVEFIISNVLAGVDEKIKPLQQTVVQDKYVSQVEKTAAQFPDFWDYKEQMIELAKANPMLTAAQAYKLAKADAPEKESSPKPRPSEFPRTSGTVSKKFTPTTTAEAAGKAFDEIFGKE